MIEIIKPILYPIRKLAARFVNTPELSLANTIIYKAANIIASDKIEGDYLEFGVFTGRSFIQAYHVIKEVFKQNQIFDPGCTDKGAGEIRGIWDKMRFFAFDSFQGLPLPDGLDTESRDFVAGKFACTENNFRANLSKAGMPLSKVVMVAGWFENTCKEDTIRKYGMKKASIIHVDCDLYSSAKMVLEFVKPLLTDGTIIIFNDWYCFRGNPVLGEQRAFNEWKATMTDWMFTEYQKEGPWGNSFIANNKGDKSNESETKEKPAAG